MPAMFVSHGSPMFALEPGLAGKNLTAHAQAFTRAKALLVISPHWCTRGNAITTAEQQETIHDFWGFPKELYQLQYPAPGSYKIALEIMGVLQEQGVAVQEDNQRGLDHGTWVPLRYLRPEADIPVIQLSLNVQLQPEQIVALGEALAPLREKGVAVIGSGCVTHNLQDIQMRSKKSASYAVRFQQWLRTQVLERNIRNMVNPVSVQQDFMRAHPSPDHYLPLLVAIGASNNADTLTVLESGIMDHAISMESYLWA